MFAAPPLLVHQCSTGTKRVAELCAIALGGRIGYFTGDPLRLLEDAQILKPNFFPSVPRVLNRVYQAAMAGGNVPGLKGNLFRKALSTKLERLRTTGVATHPLWDRLVFRKVRLPATKSRYKCVLITP
jgi:long-chain acyl-CoA synthetase